MKEGGEVCESHWRLKAMLPSTNSLLVSPSFATSTISVLAILAEILLSGTIRGLATALDSAPKRLVGASQSTAQIVGIDPPRNS